jgi:hypothetical protein
VWEHHYNRHVKSVMKSGQPASAQVMLAEPCSLPGERTGDVSWPWNMHMQVVPVQDAPFELQVRMEIPILMNPSAGTTLQVIYDPDKPQSIIVDPASVPKDQKEALTEQAIETVRARGGDTTGMQEAADAASDPIAASQAAFAQATRNQAAQTNAQLAAFLRVRSEQGEAAAAALAEAQKRALLEKMFPGRAFGADAIAPTPPETAPASSDQTGAIQAKLEQLVRLKADGALDEQEYEAARKRVIDSL